MKPRGMDGPVDLYLYRPVGFAVAWLLSYTKIRPNDVTMLSMALGAAAGMAACSGGAPGFLLCALLLQAANYLDCADGQLARLTGRGSPEGRIIDGLGDLVVNLCIFAGSVVGLVHGGRTLGYALALVAFAGLCKVITNMHYDRAISRYADRLCDGEHEGFIDNPEEARAFARKTRGFNRLIWAVYSVYLRLQTLGAEAYNKAKAPAPFATTEEAEAYSRTMLPLLSIWSFVGPSAHALYFLVFAALGHIEQYFEVCVALAVANGFCLAAERLVERRSGGQAAARETVPAQAVSDDPRARRREP